MSILKFSFGLKRADAPKQPAKDLLAGVLRAFMFWNTAPLNPFREEDGLFAYHSGRSWSEKFCGRMEAIGVLVDAGRRGYRVTIRHDAIDAYSSFLVDAGLDVEEIVSTFVVLLVGGVRELLPVRKEVFDPKYYDNYDGTTSFDTRVMLGSLVELGYAKQVDEKYIWTDRMHRIFAQLGVSYDQSPPATR